MEVRSIAKAGADGGQRLSRADRREATRARVLKAAREIFFRDGFADTNLDEIAARAEVGKGTLYRHFESKAELYVAVLAEGGAVFNERLDGVIDYDAPALDQLRAVGRFYRAYWTEHHEHFAIFSAVNNQGIIGHLPPNQVQEIRAIWETPLRRIEQVVAGGVRSGEVRAVDPWVIANVIMRSGNAAVEALITPRRERVLDCSAESIFENTLEVLIRGIEAR